MQKNLLQKVLDVSGEMPFHERLRVGLCLTWVGGFLEVYTFLLHGGVFANAQTGNLLLLPRKSACSLLSFADWCVFCGSVYQRMDSQPANCSAKHRLAAHHFARGSGCVFGNRALAQGHR